MDKQTARDLMMKWAETVQHFISIGEGQTTWCRYAEEMVAHYETMVKAR